MALKGNELARHNRPYMSVHIPKGKVNAKGHTRCFQSYYHLEKSKGTEAMKGPTMASWERERERKRKEQEKHTGSSQR